MISIWTTILVAIISSGSALLAGYMTNRATEKRLDKQIELENLRELRKAKLLKAEKLYASLVRFKMMSFNIQMDWISLAKGELTISELNNKNSVRKFDDHTLLQAKMGVYFPDLLEAFDKSRDMLKPANDCYFKMTRGVALSKETKLGYVNIILDAGKKCDEGIEKILTELSRKVNSV